MTSVPIKSIAWFILLIISLVAVFENIGVRGLVRMFPEGWRWWQLPAQVVSLAVFSTVVLYHPF